MPRYESVTLNVPGSTTKLGPFFNKGGAALPIDLGVSLERIPGGKIKLEPVISNAPTPKGLRRGYAGEQALKKYVETIGFEGGLLLSYGDTSPHGFPIGGTGLSDAEAVGAVLAAAVLLDQNPTEKQVILASVIGDIYGHINNVAASTMGGTVYRYNSSNNSATLFRRLTTSKDLGLVIGSPSNKKTQGANGAFRNGELKPLKKDLHDKHGIAVDILGTGQIVRFGFKKERYPDTEEAKLAINTWFEKHDIGLTLRNQPIAEKIADQGAYAHAQEIFPQSALARAGSKW